MKYQTHFRGARDGRIFRQTWTVRRCRICRVIFHCNPRKLDSFLYNEYDDGTNESDDG